MSEPTPQLQLIVVTGMSGSGISTAIDALEDLGAFCVDNLPSPLVPKLVELAASNPQTQRLVLGLDARGVARPDEIWQLIGLLDEADHEHNVARQVLFLEASDEVLLRRFSVSRRPHPLGSHISLPQAIRQERVLMHPFRESAHHIIDTSDLNVHECKRAVQQFVEGDRQSRLAISVLSFGFRHGVPPEADIVWDVRFLPNPHFDPALRPFSGKDAAVRDYVLGKPVTRTFLEGFLPLLDGVLPQYEQEGKSYLTVAIGCTGGRHRSVAIAEHVGAHLEAGEYSASVRHRDVEKGTHAPGEKTTP